MLIEKDGPGIRTRVLLLVSLLLIIAGTTASCLLIIRSRLRQQVQTNLATDLQHSVETFRDLEGRRRSALERENRLLASLPSLKALMTTSDPRTIADDADDFWKTSGNDLFALTDEDGRVVAAIAHGGKKSAELNGDLQTVLKNPAKHYVMTGGELYEFSVCPIYFGSKVEGTLLGYVVSGYAIDHEFLQEVGRGAGADAAFVAGNEIAVSTLSTDKQNFLKTRLERVGLGETASIMVGRERFLASSVDLTKDSAIPLRLVVMKSFDVADRAEHEINRLVFLASLLAMVAGTALMLLLARMVTSPLEKLATGVRAFGGGDLRHALPSGGPQEVRYLSRVFAEMRDEIQKKNRALLENERLATIGRMASSVSHDLRHYLAAVYANAEFLASPALPASERAELYEEIRLAVNGTTDMLDSLLIFGRTGSALQRVPTTMISLVERAVALIRTHPDADKVTIRMPACEKETTASLDMKQVERAIYNLLLNACQSARQSIWRQEVLVEVDASDAEVTVTITDSGLGVAEGVRANLFEPFVSEGKQKGTGLGLTLAVSVAREHDGDVKLLSSRPGETIFRLSASRHMGEGTENKADQIRGTLLAS